MRNHLFAATVLLLVEHVLYAQTASAAETKGVIKDGYWGCLTEEYLDQFIKFAVRHDVDGMLSLESACWMIGGLKYSLLDGVWSKARVRVYHRGASLDVWTPIEALP
jgi:hypothetical protein